MGGNLPLSDGAPDEKVAWLAGTKVVLMDAWSVDV